MSELQMGLIGAGGAVVLGIFAFNKWQERRQRKLAEPPVPTEPQASGTAARGGEARIEPVLGAATPRPVAARPAPTAGPRRVPPPLPAEVDERADCVVRVESIEPVQGSRLLQAAAQHLQGIAKPVRWFGFSDHDNRWETLDGAPGHGYHWICAALQLVDRRGPVSEGDLSAFCGGLQRMCDIFMGIPSLPVKAEALDRATELDRLCAGVDIQIGVNVVARELPIPGTKLRGLAEAAGLELGTDGCFHARDDLGLSQFVLSNLEPVRFVAEEMRGLSTQGVTLTLDVPRVADGVKVFDRMMTVAQQLAEALNGAVVDDNRTPFGDKAAGLIRAQIEQFQVQMGEQGIAPGSTLARRLFA
ncbi:MAG TPA: cell division protein ZipA C-terminal FtsZ-binding domain-containing protein [Zoogloea sp.]|uniref:cell division protein ZipA C-terminal FtsZ-binding domain-containing protein n=1 Tax=Zoogloea sp. TaxID=49181 RepID=UPI002CAE7051|nr:cell division protein ZipA C-terminal FtsZ-binding domain-containing protein [Zoogloea sp.]HMV16657.1 cell division protein ZipA C-terminal FtsZ-binding domain-containing protein [Rhodocyclaceae bacterium]HMV63651.1 cell division protein ZipA C-terminal FtsZ-binding domain-containing protein [Rhodocyclaceae bacterium]HMW52181.1 cell division protein ZipA C-terminal FtsZ-binding domain-containing protein [Rhodocyclaceae bacterium]HMY49289.1 cell division protein ZipA C-terminal FtsZ-binding d